MERMCSSKSDGANITLKQAETYVKVSTNKQRKWWNIVQFYQKCDTTYV